jgi:hypothetical protein
MKAGGQTVSYLSAQHIATANEWHFHVLTVAQIDVYNNQNAGQPAGTRPPWATKARSVITVYFTEQVINIAPNRIGIPGPEMVNAAVPNTPIGEFTYAAFTEFKTVGTVLMGRVTDDTLPYVRGGFTIKQHEPFFNVYSGLSSYPDVVEPYNYDQFLPLLIQDSKTAFSRKTSDLQRCIRMQSGDVDSKLTPSLVGDCNLGYYLQNDVVQNEKHLSSISEPLPYFEKHTQLFVTADVAPLDPVKITFQTVFGMPDLLLFRIRQLVSNYNVSVDYKHYHAKIDSLTLRIYGYDNTLLKSIDNRQFRELTRQNTNTLADKPDYVVLLSKVDLGRCGDPSQEHRIRFEFELKAFSQAYEFRALQKELVISSVYYKAHALQGTIDGLQVRKFYKQ